MKKLISLMIAMVLIISCAAFAEVEITTQGNARLNVPADTATIMINVCESDESAVKAQSNANEKIALVQAACVEAGVAEENITVDCIRVNVYNDTYDDAAVTAVKRYEASTTVTIVVNDMELAGGVIDAAIAAGADNIYGATFTLSDPKMYCENVMQAAITDARTKAEIMAAQLGLKITGVKCVNETYSDSYESSGIMLQDTAEVQSINRKTEVGNASVIVNETLQITFIAE